MNIFDIDKLTQKFRDLSQKNWECLMVIHFGIIEGLKLKQSKKHLLGINK